LDYVPLPADVKALVRESWKQIADGSGKAVWK
jgi:phosphate transport system substrate-binding protein